MKLTVIEKGKSVLIQLVHTYVTVNLVFDLTILVSQNSPTQKHPTQTQGHLLLVKSREVLRNSKFLQIFKMIMIPLSLFMQCLDRNFEQFSS